MPTKPAQRRDRRPAPQRRPKHAPAESEQEILRAAERLIRERPIRDVTVAAIMAATGLKRPAFWAYFKDRNELIIRISQRVLDELVEAAQQWLASTAATREDLIVAIERATVVYAENGALVRALADAAPNDAEAEAAYTGIVEGLAAAGAKQIRAEQARGHISGEIDAAETARALVWMNERYLYQRLSRDPDANMSAPASMLARIWITALYGDMPSDSD